ncbi:MAG: hypothetical protein ACLP07_03500 [Terracidiphilus sp.]
MIGSIRIADIPQLAITVIVFVILTGAFFGPLEHFDLEKAMPGWALVSLIVFIVAASAVVGHYIWKWWDDR